MAEVDWLLTTINSRTTVDQLKRIIAAMPPQYRGDQPIGSFSSYVKKADIMRWIESRRRAYWDLPKSERQHSLSPPRRKADLCEITAAEVNRWLRSLPPVPPYPETNEEPHD